MPTTTIQIQTADGPCTTVVATPEGSGRWPAVIVCFDAGGIRPSQIEIAERIAREGYVALLPDLFHRSPPLSELLGGPVTMDLVRQAFSDKEKAPQFMANYYGHAVDNAKLKVTIGAVLDHLAARNDVRGKVGTTGYCMGGNASLRLAEIFGDRIAATATVHAGRIVVDSPDSPHKHVDQIKSRVYIAGASDDPSFTDADKATLDAALKAAGVRYQIETYPAKHGFAVSDHVGIYDPACAERHYQALAKLYGETLHA
jgi:carboxymethylenebutenolidase